MLDEWQEVPAVWDAARRAVDDSGGQKGLYILTGSSTPEKDKVSHSGAGRIARVDMSTMTLLERGIARGGVSLAGLFEGEFEPGLAQATGLVELADVICIGGWPALVGASPEDAAEVNCNVFTDTGRWPEDIEVADVYTKKHLSYPHKPNRSKVFFNARSWLNSRR